MSGEICAIFMSSSPREPAEIKTCCDAKSSRHLSRPMKGFEALISLPDRPWSTAAKPRMSGIEPGVLQDDRHVRFEYRGVVGIARDRRRVVEIVETQMQASGVRQRSGDTGRRDRDQRKKL